MKLTRIAGGNCNNVDCPTVYVTDSGSIAVQGPIVDEETPAGEAMVEIPIEVYKEASRALGRS